MSAWWKRFKPNQSTLPAAALATVFCGIPLLMIWTVPPSQSTNVDRFGSALSRTLAHSSAGLILNQERIALSVIANQVSQYDEVEGVVFYTASNEIIVLSGATEASENFVASANLDDTLAGYVKIYLDREAFAPPARTLSWLLSILCLGVAPFLSLGMLQLSARGNRSLPIVSVPEPPAAKKQSSFCLTINLYNQLALGRQARQGAIADAITLAQELCAIHPGIFVEVPERGVIILLEPKNVTSAQAICASFLVQRLLSEFETQGVFRAYLSKVECPGSPAEMQSLSIGTLEEDVDIDSCLTLAALARPHTALVSEDIYQALQDSEKVWAKVFTHPLLEDVETTAHTFLIDALPPQESDLVDSQAMLVLGFTQA